MPHYTFWNEVTARYKVLLEKNERFDIAIECCKHIYNYVICDISVCPGACHDLCMVSAWHEPTINSASAILKYGTVHSPRYWYSLPFVPSGRSSLYCFWCHPSSAVPHCGTYCSTVPASGITPYLHLFRSAQHVPGDSPAQTLQPTAGHAGRYGAVCTAFAPSRCSHDHRR